MAQQRLHAEDIRAYPARALGGLCAAIGLAFTERMLGWRAGPKPFDGVWAAHWYNAVHRSTGFAGPKAPLPEVPPVFAPLLAKALPIYEAMLAQTRKPG